MNKTHISLSFFEDIGFTYLGPVDGHNIEEIIKSFEVAKNIKDRPTCIIAKTIKGKGVSVGIGFGNIVILKNEIRKIEKNIVEDSDKELERFHKALEEVMHQMKNNTNKQLKS